MKEEKIREDINRLKIIDRGDWVEFYWKPPDYPMPEYYTERELIKTCIRKSRIIGFGESINEEDNFYRMYVDGMNLDGIWVLGTYEDFKPLLDIVHD